jgi:hypothetical protein
MRPPSIRPVRSLPLARAAFSNPSIIQESLSTPKSKRSCSLPQPRIRRSRSTSSSLISESDARALLSSTSESRNNHPEASTPLSGTHNFASSIPSRPSTSPVVVTSPVAPSHRPPASRRWFPFPSSLLSSSGGASSSNPVTPHIPPKKKRKKGDVDCLLYGTLDDQAMARLKGRSDHRPVIGVYSIAI